MWKYIKCKPCYCLDLWVFEKSVCAKICNPVKSFSVSFVCNMFTALEVLHNSDCSYPLDRLFCTIPQNSEETDQVTW